MPNDDDALDRDAQHTGPDRGGPRRPAAGPPADKGRTPDDDVMTIDTRRSSARPIPTRPVPNRQRPYGGSGRPGDPTPPAPRSAGASRTPPAPPGRHRHRGRRIAGVVALVLIVWIGSLVWAGLTAWGKVTKIAAEPTVSNRPAAGSGHNYLLVGSDSRAGLTKSQRKKLATGSAAGQRTDSIMLVHLPESGDPTLVSIPRDSYVPIRGYRDNKVNAAFSFGGAPLLVDTVEQATGLRVDGYVQVGFGGFSSVVDSVGGVRMCLKKAMKDPKAGINLPAGCQVLDGKNALGYVRARYSDPLGDLGRMNRQREFLGALMSKAASPANVLLPWRLHSLGSAGAQALTVDENDSMSEVAKVLLAVRSVAKGQGQSLTVPVSDTNLQTHAGSAIKWDRQKALALFGALRTDTPLSVQP